MNIGSLQYNEVFVFGSNLQGRHGKGAALEAKQKYGAIEGIGYGYMGQCFAIPTKQSPYLRLELWQIQHYINHFLSFAETSDSFFLVTPIGCGLAGYSPEEIGPMFKPVVQFPTDFSNVKLPEVFLSVINGMKTK